MLLRENGFWAGKIKVRSLFVVCILSVENKWKAVLLYISANRITCLSPNVLYVLPQAPFPCSQCTFHLDSILTPVKFIFFHVLPEILLHFKALPMVISLLNCWISLFNKYIIHQIQLVLQVQSLTCRFDSSHCQTEGPN